MTIGCVQPGTRRGTFLQMIGSRKITPPMMLRMVPLGERHIFLRLNSFTRASSGVMHPSPLFLVPSYCYHRCAAGNARCFRQAASVRSGQSPLLPLACPPLCPYDSGLTRVGNKKNPIWRVVVADQRSPRDGRFIETIGHYNPQTEPSTIVIDEERLEHWLARGAQPTNTVKQLVRAQSKGASAVAVAEPEPERSPEPEPEPDAPAE